MRVLAYPAAQDGSAEYRIKLPAAALAAQGCDVQVGDRSQPLNPEEASLIVIQRPMNSGVPGVIRECQRMGIAVAVDIDDHFDALDRDHALKLTGATRATIHESCALADVVTCTTPALAAVYGHGHGVVIPNYIPAAMLDAVPLYQHPGEFWIGWTGTVRSHPHDLQVMGNGLARALSDTPQARFAVIGSDEGVRKAAGVKVLGLLGWADFEQYPYAYAAFDAAIVPLAGTAFNDAKSWLKGLEAAAVGVPFLASPTAEYRRLHALGAGQLAVYPADWRRGLNDLAASPELCAELAGRGREVAASLTIEAHAGRYWEAWTEALLNRRAHAA